MRHVVLTRSSFGPEWPLEANRRRLALTSAVTSALMARQTNRDWRWIVLVDERDALLEERIEVFRAGAPALTVLRWQPRAVEAAPWDPLAAKTNRIQRVAATAYRAPWREAIGPADEPTLMTRLDDDDGFAPDALERIANAGGRLSDRTALMLPIGVRTWRGRFSWVEHPTNAMQTLFAPAGDELLVYDYGHRKVHEVAPVLMVDRRPGWLWVRHRDTISGYHRADHKVGTRVRRLFPIDWAAVA